MDLPRRCSRAAPPRPRPFARRRFAGERRGDALQDRHEILRAGVAEINHLRVAAVVHRRVEMRDQRAHAQAAAFAAGKQNGIGAFVGEYFRLVAQISVGAFRVGKLRERARNFGGARVLQRNHFDACVGNRIDALDDADHARDIAGAIGNHQRIGSRMRDELRALRNQRAQDRHQFVRRHVFDRNDLRDQFVGLVALVPLSPPEPSCCAIASGTIL